MRNRKQKSGQAGKLVGSWKKLFGYCDRYRKSDCGGADLRRAGNRVYPDRPQPSVGYDRLHHRRYCAGHRKAGRDIRGGVGECFRQSESGGQSRVLGLLRMSRCPPAKNLRGILLSMVP